MASRTIWLCADDYGMAPGINAAIRELIARGRLNAASVMVASPHFDAAAASALQNLNVGETRAALGLHVTLTAPYAPMSTGYAPIRAGRFLSLAEMLRAAIGRRLAPEALAAEIAAQVRAFIDAFGRPPDFIDGHQHVQLLPQARDAFLNVASQFAPDAWVRQCGRPARARVWHDGKGLFLDLLSIAFRRKAARLGIRSNSAFAGTYSFSSKARYADLFPRFLEDMPAGGLIMCHPGFVDAELEAVDPVTKPREHEFTYFNSEAFPRLLAERGVALAKPADRPS